MKEGFDSCPYGSLFQNVTGRQWSGDQPFTSPTVSGTNLVATCVLVCSCGFPSTSPPCRHATRGVYLSVRHLMDIWAVFRVWLFRRKLLRTFIQKSVWRPRAVSRTQAPECARVGSDGESVSNFITSGHTGLAFWLGNRVPLSVAP